MEEMINGRLTQLSAQLSIWAIVARHRYRSGLWVRNPFKMERFGEDFFF